MKIHNTGYNRLSANNKTNRNTNTDTEIIVRHQY